jgi:hypothetical protein
MNYTTESDSYKVQANIKFGHSLQHMINVRANDVNELSHLLDSLASATNFINSTVAEIAEPSTPVQEHQAVQNLQQQFPQTQQIQPGVVTPYAQPQQQPRTYGQPPAQERCAHGLVYELKKGVKNGKEWAGNFCAAPREGINGVPRCEPKFFG